jgi:hypothetical protein
VGGRTARGEENGRKVGEGRKTERKRINKNKAGRLGGGDERCTRNRKKGGGGVYRNQEGLQHSRWPVWPGTDHKKWLDESPT